LKISRVFLVIVFALLCLTALPLERTRPFRTGLYSVLVTPMSVSNGVSRFFADLLSFRKNAEENRSLHKVLAAARRDRLTALDLKSENARLNKLLELKPSLGPDVRKTVFARVVGRSPASWNRVFFIDKGSKDRVKPNMLVLSEWALIGKVATSGPAASQVLVLTDPNFKIGAVIQRTRHHGILFGTASGECRMKYIPVEAELKEGDIVETAGLGSFFPKGILVGRVKRTWKEPGQIYQVALIKPAADLGRVEEVVCVE
jgi:rod shape-determining protein MreC